MTKIATTLAIALSLSGCAGAITTATNDINALTGALSSPQATQAAANLKAGMTALLCDVGDVAALASAIETQVKAGKAAIKDTQTLYVISGDTCLTLGGQVIGPTTVPAGVTSGS